MRRLRPHLYFGASVHPPDLQHLRRAQISAILSLQEPGVDLLTAAVERMRAACEPGIRFVNVPIHDHDPHAIIARLPEALERLDELINERRTVYVHCSEGVNRAPSVSLAHIVCHEGLTVDAALAEILRCDRGARPYAEVVDWLRQGRR